MFWIDPRVLLDNQRARDELREHLPDQQTIPQDQIGQLGGVTRPANQSENGVQSVT